MKIAVVGHTNVGKTSLMRTLMRRGDFGVVSIHPATTRHVEKAEIKIPGHETLALFDTPGLEDPSGLLIHLSALKEKRGEDWIECLQAFVASPSLQMSFSQEAKAIGQILASDVVFYVIDARLNMKVKYRDELEILGRCARPVVPILNFVADGEAKSTRWKEQLARVNMHAVVSFDTVVFDEASEITLYEKVGTLLDAKAPLLKALIEDLHQRRRAIRAASYTVIAEMLMDVTMARMRFDRADEHQARQTMDDFQNLVRTRENEAINALLDLHNFAKNSYIDEDLAFTDGAWREDAFDIHALERFGFDAGKAMASGAAAGLAIDLLVGGVTLGAAALTGAALGFVLDSARRYGGRLKDAVRGQSAVKADELVLMHLAERELTLLAALLRRGHGAQDPVQRATRITVEQLAPLIEKLVKMRPRLNWSKLNGVTDFNPTQKRRETIQNLSSFIDQILQGDIPRQS